MSVKVTELMTRAVLTGEPGMAVNDARRLMEQHRVSAIPVIDASDRPIGIVSSSDLLSSLSAELPISRVMTSRVLSVSPDDDVRTAARLMRDHAVHHVVVTDGQTVIGMLSTFDLLEIVEGQGAPGRIPSIATVMTSSPHCVAVDDSVLRARALMVQLQVRHLPVTEGGTLVGVISDRDLKRALDPDLGLPAREELFVRDVYVPGAYTVEGHEPLDRVLEHMAHHHVGSVLVTREDQLVGILTSTDACRLFCEHLRSWSHH